MESVKGGDKMKQLYILADERCLRCKHNRVIRNGILYMFMKCNVFVPGDDVSTTQSCTYFKPKER